ncbi:MAG: MerR family transcriptional regulator [Gemmatimonadota bacterium]|nr:MerR family transcriptional regulator [Gemmatimonadota bacterium]
MRFAHLLDPDLDFDLTGLCAAATPLLLRLPVDDGRIQSTPDGRTLRFYQSSGLLDRPRRYEGRVARYGRRHLLQVLAVRVLQSQAHSLAQIQAELAGATDTELSSIVDSALGAYLPDRSTRTPPPALPVAPTLTSVELAPGVVVTVDSRFHPDSLRLIEILRRAIQGEQS